MTDADDVPEGYDVIDTECLHCVISHVVTHYAQALMSSGETVSWEKIVSNLLQVVAEAVVARPPVDRDKMTLALPEVLAIQLKEARKGFDAETARIEKAAYTHAAPKGTN